MTQQTSTVLDGLHDEQRKAVTHSDGPLLIIAGAGTGKTTVITKRFAWLILEKGLQPSEILALTFTEKAAQEMEERVDQLLPFGYVDLWISTFHSFCERILRDWGTDIGLSHDFTILDETSQAVLMREHFERFELSYYRPLGNPTKFIHVLLRHFSRAKDEGIAPKEYLSYAQQLSADEDQVEFRKGDASIVAEHARIAEVAHAYHTYQQLLLEYNSLDFGDLLLYTLKLLKERPKAREEFQKKFKHILVDEFQDTNHAQYEIVRMLVNAEKNLAVVGDDDQSIYKFRGAAISNILEFKKDFPDASEVVLTKNYRTKQNILDLAYGFIQQNNPNRLEAALGTRDGHAISKRLTATREGMGYVEHLHESTNIEEAKSVVKRILDLKEQNSDAQWCDFAILVRANDHATPFLPMLDRHAIPYQFLAAKGLYQQPVILDLVNYLSLLDNYRESAACFRVLQFGIWRVPAEDIMLLLDESKKRTESLFETCKRARLIRGLTPATVPILEKIIAFIEKHNRLARKDPVGQVLLTMLNETGYLADITEKQDLQSVQKSFLIKNFYDIITRFQDSHAEPTVRNFLHELRLSREIGDTGSIEATAEDIGPDALHVMTVHAAKGLEFRFVFLVSLVDKRFPSVERRDSLPLPEALVKETLPAGNAVHLEEERRLFYVGITRARDGVFFSSSEDYGGVRKKKISQFLVETGFVPKLPKRGVQDVMSMGTVVIEATQSTSNEMKLLRSKIPSKFSFSQFQAFTICPKQYKYAHLLHVPTIGKFNFSFGKSLHACALRIFQPVRALQARAQADLFGQQARISQTLPTREELKKIFAEEWVDEWYFSEAHKKEYYQKGLRELERLVNVHEANVPRVKYLEQPFVMRIGESMIKGVIDRIDQITGGVHIIDYKTGSAPQKADRTKEEDSWQLYLYALACKEVLHEIPVRLSYYYFELGEYVDVPLDDSRLHVIREKTEDTIQSIMTSTFLPTPTEWKCSHCDFRDICEDRVT